MREKILNEWLPLNKPDAPLWKFGSQPLMLLAFYKAWYALPESWYAIGLGNQGYEISEERKKEIFILHWNGQNKPWLDKDMSEKY